MILMLCISKYTSTPPRSGTLILNMLWPDWIFDGEVYDHSNIIDEVFWELLAFPTNYVIGKFASVFQAGLLAILGASRQVI